MSSLRQVAVRKLAFPAWALTFRPGLYPALREYERSQFWPADRMEAMQWDRLQRMLSFSYEASPFYRQRFRAAGLHPQDIRSKEDLLGLPPLTKDDIQKSEPTMIAEGLSAQEYEDDFTGGSTGSPLHFKVSRERRQTRNAIAIRHDRWSGWDFGAPLGVLWGHPTEQPGAPQWRHRLREAVLGSKLWLNTYELRRSEIASFLDRLGREKVRFLQAYSRSLLALAQFVAENGLRPPPLAGAITTAESLTAEERKFIEAALHCPTFDRYGCREVGLIASECGAHDGLHVAAEGLLVEVVAGDRHALPGEAGEVLVTDLLNWAMPLIRYRIGDVAGTLQGDCACGRGLPRLRMVAGRVTDFIHTPDGRWLSGVAINTYLISKIPGVRQVQIVQESCDSIRFRMVPAEGGQPAAEQFLRQQVPEIFGTAMRHSAEWVDSLPPLASGKIRVTISRCADLHGFGAGAEKVAADAAL